MKKHLKQKIALLLTAAMVFTMNTATFALGAGIDDDTGSIQDDGGTSVDDSVTNIAGITWGAKTDSIYYDDLSYLGICSDPLDRDAIRNKMADYVEVKQYTYNITSSPNMKYRFANTISGNNGVWSEEVVGVDIGGILYVSGNYSADMGGGPEEHLFTVPLTVKKQPISIRAASEDGIKITSLVGKELDADIIGKLEVYTGNITVSRCDTGKDMPLIGQDGGTSVDVEMGNWLSRPSLNLDEASKSRLSRINVNFAGEYPLNYDLVPDDLNNDVSGKYEITGGMTGYLKIEDGVIVGFYRADTAKQIGDNLTFKHEELADTPVELQKAVGIDKKIVNWALITNETSGKGIRVISGNEFYPNLSWKNTGNNGILGTYVFDLSDFSNRTNVKTIKLYGYFSDTAETIGKKDTPVTKAGITVSVSNITPVVYTGNKFYLSDDPKGYKSKTNEPKNGIDPVLDLRVSNADTGAKLKAGTDFTVSYKNNVNAANTTAETKAPQVILKGKGNYKGFTLTVPFTILPVDMQTMAKVNAGKTRYIKYGKKGFDSRYTVVQRNDVKNRKIKKAVYKLIYYNEDGIEVNPSDYTSAITDRVTKFFVTARAVPDKKGNSNYIGETGFNPGDPFDNSIAYGIPTKSKSLKVNISSKKVDFTADKKPGELFTVNGVTGPKKETLSDNDYTIRFLNEEQDEDITGKTISSGNIYVSAELNDIKKMNELSVFQPTRVKLTVKGTKVSGIKLEPKSLTFIDATDELKFVLPAKISEKKYLEWSPEGDGLWINMALKDSFHALSDNRSAGAYTVNVRGTGPYTGTQTVKYNVKAGKIVNDSNVEIIINDNKPVPINLAGLYKDQAEKVRVSFNGMKLELYRDYTLNFIKPSKTGQDVGRLTVKFVNNYSGSVKKTFDICKADVGESGNVIVKELSVPSTAISKTPGVELYQEDRVPKYSNGIVTGWTIKTQKIKAGTNYGVETISENGADSVTGIVKGSGVFEGSRNVTSYCYAPEKEILKIEVTAVTDGTYTDEGEVSENGTVNACTSGGKHYVKFIGDMNGDGSPAFVCPTVSEVKVTYKDKSTYIVSGTDIKKLFDVAYSGNQDIGNKSGIIVSAKNVKGLAGGPNSKEYTTKFIITGEKNFPKTS
ncbi:MAG: hypothetical protein K6A90_14985 [Lachnospiraceae bacterium]|nr:hypothetical protein [Lachnospiraceae bacterium]